MQKDLLISKIFLDPQNFYQNMNLS